MGKKSAPAAPNYTKAAEKSAASNQDAQTRADWANRPTQNTPWGQSSWQSSSAIDPATGKPVTSWAQNITLSPQQQAALDQQMKLQQGQSEIAGGMLGRLQDAYQKPFDWGGMQDYGKAPTAGGLQAGNLDPTQFQTSGAGQGIKGSLDTGSLGQMPTADDAGRQRIEQALMDRMRPENERTQRGLETKLANMGLTRGSEAWNREMQRLGDQQSRQAFDAMNTAGMEQQRQFGMGMQGRQQGWNEMLGSGQFQNAAQNQGYGQQLGQNAQNYGMFQGAGAQNFGQQQAAGSQNFNQGMQASEYNNKLRQQQIAEQAMQRGMPLNELNALLTGQQVGMPSMPGFSQSQRAGSVDYSGAANDQYNASLDAYNARQAGTQGIFSGLGSIGGAALGGPMGGWMGSKLFG